MTLRDALLPSQWDELLEILGSEDQYLLGLVKSGAALTGAQQSILDDIVASAAMASFDPEDEWAPTESTDRLETLSGAVSRALPNRFPAQRWVGESPPFDRYEEFGEVRPAEHPPRPLRPGGWSPPPPPAPLDIDRPSAKLGGWSVSALDKMDEFGIKPSQLEETFYRPGRRCVLDGPHQIWLISDDRFELHVNAERTVVDFSVKEVRHEN